MIEPFRSALLEYDSWQTTQARQQKTRNAYKSRVRGYLNYLAQSASNSLSSEEDHRDIEKALSNRTSRDRHVSAFLVWKQRKGCRMNTVNAHLDALKDFYNQRGIGAPKVKPISKDALEHRRLDERQQQLFLFSARRYANTRDELICLMFYYTGMTVSELAALDETSIGTEGDCTLLAVKANGRLCYRVLQLHPDVVDRLPLYINARRAQGIDSGPLFMAGNRRISIKHLNQIVREVGQLGDLDINPRTLRETFVDNLVAVGVDLDDIRYYAGFSSLASLHRYLPRTEERQPLPVDKLPRLAMSFRRKHEDHHTTQR